MGPLLTDRDRIGLRSRATWPRSDAHLAAASARPRWRSATARCWPASTTTGCWRPAIATPNAEHGAGRVGRRGATPQARRRSRAAGWPWTPLDEAAARDLMRRLAEPAIAPARSGLRPLAERLRHAAGTAPSAATRDAAAQLRAGAPPAVPAQARGAGDPAASWALVGRDVELGRCWRGGPRRRACWPS